MPLLTVLGCAGGLLLWNFSFYRSYYDAQAADHGALSQASRSALAAHRRLPSASTATAFSASLTAPPARTSGRLQAHHAERQTAGAEGTKSPQADQGGGGQDVDNRTAAGSSLVSTDGRVAYEDPDEGLRGWLQGGKRTGLWVASYESGHLRSEGHYEDDLREGRWVYWYEDGGPQHSGEYQEGRRHGTWVSWHANRLTRSEQTFDQGVPVGRWSLWYSNGQVKEAGYYIRGLREGWWEFYDFAGNPDLRTGRYAAGKRLAR